MNKVVRIPLLVEVTDINNNPLDYKDVYKLLWKLQDEVRTIKNKTIQQAWEWNNFSADYKAQNGAYPKMSDVSAYKTFSGYIYDKFKVNYHLNTANLSYEIRDAESQFKTNVKDIIKGEKSILEYKKNQPLNLHDKTIKLSYEDKQFMFSLSLFNKGFAKENNIPCSLTFKAQVKSNSQKVILERCVDGIYKISASQLLYDKKKKMWCINLCYKFEAKKDTNLDENKILGVDLGVAKPIMASVYGDKDRFFIDGGEVEHVRNTVEARRKSMLKQGKWCGEGRIGHGYNTRVRPLENVSDKICRCRDTINHKYSKHLIDYAVENGCGTIQMENLKGITDTADRFLKSWSYFDLQTKIEYKAKEKGIKVVYIEPKYTSKRCSKCGYIHKDNRTEQAKFKCLSCGFEENADYNASQNIAIRDIDKIISANMK